MSTQPDGLPQGTKPSTKDWLALAVLSVGLGLIVLDGTIVGVALPIIIEDLQMDLTDAQWVNSLYAVVLAAILLSSGSMSDRWGRKRAFLMGVVVFVLGSMLAASASSAGYLIGSRAVQAVGAAMIMPSTLSTVNAVFRGTYRAAAFGVWGAVISGAAAIGPLAGGALTQWVSWHWIFLVNLPIGVIVFAAAWITVPETRGKPMGRGVDVDGAILSAIGFGALVFAIIEGPDLGWWKPQADLNLLGWKWTQNAPISAVPVAFAISVVALSLFLYWEQRRKRIGRAALLDLSLFKLRTFSWGNITAAMVAVGEFALIFVLPLYLVNALGLDVMGAGMVFAAMAVGAFFSGASARHMAARFGSPGTVIVGLALEVVGVVILIFLLRPDTDAASVAGPLVIYGLGLGLASAQLTGTVLSEVPVQISGQGSATQSTVRQLGSALGTAVSGAALSVALRITIPASLEPLNLDAGVVKQMAASTRQSAGTSISILRAGGGDGDPTQTDALVSALSSGFTNATAWSLWVAVFFLTLGLVGAIRLNAASHRVGADFA